MDELDQWADSPVWDNELSKQVYQLPLNLTIDEAAVQGNQLRIGIPANELYMTAHYMCCQSSQTHRAAFKHAIDFLVLDGAPILAAGSGMVIEIQQHSNEWGDDIAYRDKLNYITIQHSPTEFTQYCHLAKHSVCDAGLYVGSPVKAGQVIGTVGKTGLTDRDHLHFIVFRLDRNPSPFGFKSLVPRWK
ncbi:MAG: hypothetical protein RLZZ70_696 [Candidatus Parcubacteria bacterium]|jgi:murein DD-endopeptidase MepM/ murein hydrolase activator NlpD